MNSEIGQPEVADSGGLYIILMIHENLDISQIDTNVSISYHAFIQISE